MEKNTEEIKNKIIKNYEAFDKKRVLLDDKIKRKINLERIYAPSKETVVTLADDSEIKFEKFNPGKERGILGMKKKNMNKFEYGGKKFLVLDNDIENFYTVRLLNFLGCETMRASLFKDEKIGKTFIAYEKVDSMGQFGANDRETQKIIHDNKLGDAIVQRNIITSVMGDEDNHYQNMLVTEKDGEKRIAHIDVSLSGKNSYFATKSCFRSLNLKKMETAVSNNISDPENLGDPHLEIFADIIRRDDYKKHSEKGYDEVEESLVSFYCGSEFFPENTGDEKEAEFYATYRHYLITTMKHILELNKKDLDYITLDDAEEFKVNLTTEETQREENGQFDGVKTVTPKEIKEGKEEFLFEVYIKQFMMFYIANKSGKTHEIFDLPENKKDEVNKIMEGQREKINGIYKEVLKYEYYYDINFELWEKKNKQIFFSKLFSNEKEKEDFIENIKKGAKKEEIEPKKYVERQKEKIMKEEMVPFAKNILPEIIAGIQNLQVKSDAEKKEKENEEPTSPPVEKVAKQPRAVDISSSSQSKEVPSSYDKPILSSKREIVNESNNKPEINDNPSKVSKSDVLGNLENTITKVCENLESEQTHEI